MRDVPRGLDQQPVGIATLICLLSSVGGRGTSIGHNIQPPLAFAFGPGGLLFPYYVGVAYQLRDLGLLHGFTPVGGSSSGSIISALIACEVEERRVRDSLLQLAKDVRNGESLKIALRRQLELVLPEDAARRAQRHGLAIGYLEVFPHWSKHLVTSWKSKEDIIETVLASCNFPFYFSPWPLVKCRDSWAVDGMFSTEPSRFGCPQFPADRTIAVIAGPNVDTGFNKSDLIEPGLMGMALPDDVREAWPWFTLSPAPDDTIDEMIGIGRKHAEVWAAHQRDISTLKAWRPPLLQGMLKHLRSLKPPRPQWPLPSQHSRLPWKPPYWPHFPQVQAKQLAAQTAISVFEIPAAVVTGLFAGIGVALVSLCFYRGNVAASVKPLMRV